MSWATEPGAAKVVPQQSRGHVEQEQCRSWADGHRTAWESRLADIKVFTNTSFSWIQRLDNDS